jgi:hypothetical protein
MSHNSSHPAPNDAPQRMKFTGARWAILLVVTVVIAVGLVLLFTPPTSQVAIDLPPTNTPGAAVPVTNTTAPAEPSSKPYMPLIGRWLRPDGGYVLEVKSVQANGELLVTYANPGPINVYRAQGSVEDGKTKMFVELRDVNYPGSTYSLVYDKAGDRLVGTYYQALMKETYEVEFVRQK